MNTSKCILCLYILIQGSDGVIFERFIEAIGFPYYKLSFILGNCQESRIYFENKAWPTARMNRILDIYYKSEINDFKVSSVKIKLVINNTDCVGYSERGVGYPEFSATIFFATNMAVIFYSLSIYTCSRAYEKVNITVDTDLIPDLPFLNEKQNEDDD
ncbi:uncharacterized protein LOC120631862 [Pararge aegeria]|uniref:uncharacterized protein LOC120631862 n=1 Tax=Pararge aegeria TaxID=116150 RepID=UPI0019D0485F|nr:uncharacterized protein LOC120631862 [Pararge aegeria]